MKTAQGIVLAVFAFFAGDAAPSSRAVAQEPARIVQAEFVELKYLLPERDLAASTAQRWGVGAPVQDGVADPNLIVYDEPYIRKYVEWAVNTPITDGGASYTLVMPQGERTVHTGLDEHYLGQRFLADELVRFLKTRATGKRVERTFRIENAEAVKVLRDHPDSLSAKRLHESPWDRDARSAASLLGLAGYGPAHPILAALAKERSSSLHYAATIALGRIAPAAPAAVEDLAKLLDDPDRRSTAATALALAGDAGAPALIRGLDHPQWTARNHVVYALGRMEKSAAVPVLNKALGHADPEVRLWATSVAFELTRAEPAAGKPYVKNLASRLTDDPNADTRRAAALALLNMGSFAAPASAALQHAAKKDTSDAVRDFARRALEELQAGKSSNRTAHTG